jgi:hypothetical protein
MSLAFGSGRLLEAVLTLCGAERERLMSGPWSFLASRELEHVDGLENAVYALLGHRALTAARTEVERKSEDKASLS